MRIGITSQNFQTITGHAGKTRRFIIYDAGEGTTPREIARLDLPKEMSLHDYRGDDHPIYDLHSLITASCGAGFAQRLASHGVRLITTSESDPLEAAAAVANGRPLPPASPREHAPGEGR